MGQIFTSRATIFVVVINVWPRTHWEMGTNNLTAVIEVSLIGVTLKEAKLYYFNLKDSEIMQ